MTQAALQTQWARLIIEALVLSGVSDLVLSPGARSTPLAYAALATKALSTRAVVDERTAAFFALGLAKAAARPVALLCTSGSALAHYFPALVEAAQAGVPLVVLSADRPPELQHSACPQTVDQAKFFGAFARFHAALGLAEARDDAFRLTARLVAQAVSRSLAPMPGPTHLNVPFRAPLAPEASTPGGDGQLCDYADQALRGFPPPESASSTASNTALAAVARSIRSAPNGLIALGPGLCPHGLEPRLIRELARASGLPVLAETASGARLCEKLEGIPLLCDAVDHVVGRIADAHSGPLLVVQLGGPLVCGGYAGMLERVQDLELHVLSPWAWADPSGRAASVVRGTLESSVSSLTAALRGEGGAASALRRDWEARLRRHNWSWWTAVDACLGTGTTPRSGMGEPEAVRALLAALPAGSVLSVGNSLPVREVDWFSPARAGDITVFCQRGANGIDGAISGASGIAAALRRPTMALIGDLSFLHDLGGLALAGRSLVPTVIAVLNNGGGRIFEHLPLGDLAAAPATLEAGWILPQSVDIGALTAGFGLRFAAAESVSAITEALTNAFSHPGCTVIELVVAPRSTRDSLSAIRRTAGDLEG